MLIGTASLTKVGKLYGEGRDQRSPISRKAVLEDSLRSYV